MEYLITTWKKTNLSVSQFSDLLGVSYSEMSDILEGKKEPSKKLLRGCVVLNDFFLTQNNTQRVKTLDKT